MKERPKPSPSKILSPARLELFDALVIALRNAQGDHISAAKQLEMRNTQARKWILKNPHIFTPHLFKDVQKRDHGVIRRWRMVMLRQADGYPEAVNLKSYQRLLKIWKNQGYEPPFTEDQQAELDMALPTFFPRNLWGPWWSWNESDLPKKVWACESGHQVVK